VVLPDDVRQTVVSYLTHQGKKDASAIVEVIERERRRLLGLLADVSQEQAEFAPAPGQWSIREIVEHVVASERGVLAVIARLAGVAAPPEHAPAAGRSLAELREDLVSVRAQLQALVGDLPQDASLDAKQDHLFFGPLNWNEWLAFQRVHDGDHIEQIEAVQRLPSYPKA
jgi:uncharacterized damage-inducible protein DinB